MRILVELGHPAQVHTMKHSIEGLIERGHKIKIAIREREDMVGNLLDTYGYNYDNLRPASKGMLNKFINIFRNDSALSKICKRFKPDIFFGPASVYSSHVSSLRRKEYVCYGDSEAIGSMKIQYLLFKPFINCIITPEKFRTELGKKQVRVKSYKELAYLHPNRFKPDDSVYKELGLKKGERYVLLRFGSFDASHDIGKTGFSMADKEKLLKELKKHTKVFISSEEPLKGKFKKYRLPTRIERMHHVIHFASLLVGDTQTSTTEAACLGTPAIRSNKWVGPNDMSNFIELEKDFGLIFNFQNPKKVRRKAVELIEDRDLGEKWQKKRKKLLQRKIDLTSFFIWFIENYPKSKKIMKKNPNYQDKFKGVLK